MATSPYQIEDVARFAMGDVDLAQPARAAAPLARYLRIGVILVIAILAAAALTLFL